MRDSIIGTAEYNELLASVKRNLAAGQLRAAQGVDHVLGETHWRIDQDIVGRLRERDLSQALTGNLVQFLRERGFAFVGAEVPIPCGDREFFAALLFYHCRLHRYVMFDWQLGGFDPEHVGQLNFYVHLIDDNLRDQARDDPTLGMLLVIERDDVAGEIGWPGVTTSLTVTEWPRLPANVRQALPTAEDLRPTVAQAIRQTESTDCRPYSPGRARSW